MSSNDVLISLDAALAICAKHSAQFAARMIADELSALPAATVEVAHPPIAVMLAVEILCNHVEPGWENSKTIVRAWIDEERSIRTALAGPKGGAR